MTIKEMTNMMEKRALELYHIAIALGRRDRNITPHSLEAIRRKALEVQALASNLEAQHNHKNTLRDYLMRFRGQHEAVYFRP